MTTETRDSYVRRFLPAPSTASIMRTDPRYIDLARACDVWRKLVQNGIEETRLSGERRHADRAMGDVMRLVACEVALATFVQEWGV